MISILISVKKTKQRVGTKYKSNGYETLNILEMICRQAPHEEDITPDIFKVNYFEKALMIAREPLNE